MANSDEEKSEIVVTSKDILSLIQIAPIPDICHGPTGQARGEKSVMWRNFKFLYMKHVEKAKISPHLD